jgi:hypothetical protein
MTTTTRDDGHFDEGSSKRHDYVAVGARLSRQGMMMMMMTTTNDTDHWNSWVLLKLLYLLLHLLTLKHLHLLPDVTSCASSFRLASDDSRDCGVAVHWF